MTARKALLMTNHMVSMRPFVVLAIRVMGPGPRRVGMVRLAHAMTDGRSASRPSYRGLRVVGTPVRAPHAASTHRAA